MLTTKVIDQQPPKQDFTDSVIDNNVENCFKLSKDTELDLPSILVNEFGQGLAADIVIGF